MNARGIGKAVLAAVLLGGGVGLVPGVARAEKGWAEALFAEHSHDFGAVPRGAIVRHNFVLANRYDETITILDVHASCGCTTGRPWSTTVAPGQTTVIEAQM